MFFLKISSNSEITLYTKTVCPKCLLVKSELKRAGVTPVLINIEHNENAKQTIIDNGFLSVPVIQCQNEFMGDIREILLVIEASME